MPTPSTSSPQHRPVFCSNVRKYFLVPPAKKSRATIIRGLSYHSSGPSDLLYIGCCLRTHLLSCYSCSCFHVSVLGKNYVNLTAAGELTLFNFRENMSGSYTCTISYRAVRADMQADLQIFTTYKFMLYGKKNSLNLWGSQMGLIQSIFKLQTQIQKLTYKTRFNILKFTSPWWSCSLPQTTLISLVAIQWPF